eukprot:1500789-Rhodomonas_salina.1
MHTCTHAVLSHHGTCTHTHAHTHTHARLPTAAPLLACCVNFEHHMPHARDQISRTLLSDLQSASARASARGRGRCILGPHPAASALGIA